MINTREFEIRDAATALTVAAYQLLGDLAGALSPEDRTRIMDGSFKVSSLIAEAFHTSQVVISEDDLKIALSKLLDLKTEALNLAVLSKGQITSQHDFVHCAEELQVELIELLAALKQLEAEPFTPKIELACI